MARLPDRRAAAAGKRKFLGVSAESTRESLDDLDAFSIAQFCWRHNISESFYHKLRCGAGLRGVRWRLITSAASFGSPRPILRPFSPSDATADESSNVLYCHHFSEYREYSYIAETPSVLG
jgi:hypothetical protein